MEEGFVKMMNGSRRRRDALIDVIPIVFCFLSGGKERLMDKETKVIKSKF
jgi:hypothetical protein